MQTYFAPSERASPEQLRRDVELVCRTPVIDALLKTAGGLLAVLNEHRQTLALNDAFLQLLGIRNPGDVLGLRPGEIVECTHAHEMVGGCGTSKYCSTCGAAVAIVAALAGETPCERTCALVTERDGRRQEICLRVRSCRATIDGRRFVLLFLQDVTASELRASMERVFFHDISNLIMGLQGISRHLSSMVEGNARTLARQVHSLASRLANEVAVQRALVQAELTESPIKPEEVSVEEILKEISGVFADHPAASGKRISLPKASSQLRLRTNPSLLVRILTNMLTNALEASEPGGEVKVWIEPTDARITFCVWNRQPIPEDIARRVFQRHFTTKGEPGRGLGTYAMKLLGEKFLGGRVDFSTSESEGTVFRLCLPVD